MLEPCILAFGVAARRLLSFRYHRLSILLITKKSGDLWNADGAHHRQFGIEVLRKQSLDFCYGAELDHRLEPRIAAGVQPVAGRSEHDRPEGHVTNDPASLHRVPVPQLATRRADDLEGSGNACRIGGPQPFRRFWVERGKRFAIFRDLR